MAHTPPETHYGWKSTESPCSCSYLAPQILALVARLNVSRIVDVGAGNGALCAMLHAQSLDVVGVEYDQAGFEVARSSYPTIPFYHYGVQDDPSLLLEKEAPFEAVVSTEVVEHLFSPHLLPMYACRVLKAGGYLIVSTPYHGYLKNLLLAVTNKWDHHHTSLWHGGHIKFWSRDTLGRLLSDHGFRVFEFHGVGRIPYLWKSMILVAQKVVV